MFSSTVLLSSLFLLGVSADEVQRREQGNTTTISFIHINDHHSHFDEQSFDLFEARIPPGLSVETGTLRAYYGGGPRGIALAKAMAANATAEGNDACMLHAGDAMTGTLFYTFFGPKVDAALMNVAGFDAFVLGNHEFDDGDSTVAEFSRLLEMPVLSYNLIPGPESEINTLTGDDAIKPYLIKEFPSGNRVGICGITVKTVTELSSFPDAGTTIMEEHAAAEACVADVKAEGVDKIVLLSHSGYSRDMSFSDIEGVDLVIGGHSHALLGGEELEEFGFTGQGSYGMFQDGVCVVQAWDYLRVVGRIDVTFDAEGNVLGCEGGVQIPLNPDRFTVRDADPTYDLEAADAQIAADFLLSFPLFVNEGEDADIIAALQPFRDEIGERAQAVIAQVPEALCHTRGGSIDEQCPDKDLQSMVGGGVCPIVARGFLYNVPLADFAIQNAGGCRESIVEGDFTFGGAFSVLPFSNTLVTLAMTGDQIHRVLEDAFNFFLDESIGGGSGSFPVAAGLRWEVDYTQAFGERVSNIEMNIRLEEDSWTPLEMDASYRVVTNNFIATPRDGYFTFEEVDKTDPDAYVNTYIEYAQSLINFAETFGVLEEIDISEYPNQFIVFLDGSTADLRPLREVEATEEPAPEAVEEPTAAPPTSAAGVVSSTGIAGLVLASVSVLFL